MKHSYIWPLIIVTIIGLGLIGLHEACAEKKESFGASSTIEESKSQNNEEDVYTWLRTFAEVIHLVLDKHYKVKNLEQAMVKAIDAFVSSLDPHSSFLDQKAYAAMLESTSGEFFGIGVIIDNTRKSKDKYLTIVDTIPGGPADKTMATHTTIKTNVQPMDKIVEIDGNSLEDLSTEEATAKIKGERGSKVTIKVLRDSVPDLLTFEIPRDEVKEQSSTCFHIKDRNIYYIALSTFSYASVTQIESLLKKAHNQPYKGLILDLRNNSGGLLLAAIDIAGLFLPKNSLVVVTKDKNDKEIERYHTTNDPVAPNNMPIVVLINNFTASAGEILAKILQEYASLATPSNKQNPLVTTIGTKSFGKGSVQEVIPVHNNNAIRLTTALYLPNGKMIQGVGMSPDFLIEKTSPPSEQLQWFTKYYGNERALGNTIKTPESIKIEEEEKKQEKAKSKEKEGKPTRWSERMKEMLQSDNQLREAINVIQLIDTFKELCPANMKSRDQMINYLKKVHIGHDPLEIEEVKSEK